MSILDEIPVDGTLLDDLTPPYRTNKERGAAQKEVFEKVGPKLREILGMFEINTKYRIAHFLAQCAVETMDFTSLTEWDDGSAYEGKEDLGNKEKGDGPKFRGRGLIHLTGRWNYNYVNDIIHKKRYTDKFPEISKIDIVKNPEKVADISWCLIISAIFWDFKNINITADVNDVDKVTLLVNGGYNGLEERREYTKFAFILIEKRIKDAAITTKLAIPRLVFPLAGGRCVSPFGGLSIAPAATTYLLSITPPAMTSMQPGFAPAGTTPERVRGSSFVESIPWAKSMFPNRSR